MPSEDHPFTRMVLHYGMEGAGCVHRSKISPFSSSRRQSYGAMVFTVPLYLKAKSQGVLKEYDIHQDLLL
jgi:hypothetical protein